MSNGSIVIAALPIGGLSATEAASRFTRSLRAARPEIPNQRFIQLPLMDGGEGTIDLLVTNTLGSFLEVEATGATGEQVVVPLGFAGKDNKLAIVEMKRIAGSSSGQGTSYGVGELILDALDEGAFSVLLAHDEQLAADAGLGAVQALGVKFFDKKGKELDLRESPISNVARIDASGRAFQLLSSRFFMAQTPRAANSNASDALAQELARLSEIIRRDVGITVIPEGRSASGIEFGLEAFLSAQVRDGLSLVLEATEIQKQINEAQVATLILLAGSVSDLDREPIRNLLKSANQSIPNVCLLFQDEPSASEKKKLKATILTLRDAKVFAAPLDASASEETRRRDTLLRLEKLATQITL